MTAAIPAPSPGLRAAISRRARPSSRQAGAKAGGRRPPLVLSIEGRGALIEVGAKRWLMRDAPALARGAALDLELTAADRQAQPGRLLAIGGHALAPPITVRLQPVALRLGGQPPAESVVASGRRDPGRGSPDRAGRAPRGTSACALAVVHPRRRRLLRWIEALSGTVGAAEAGPAGVSEPGVGTVAWRGALGALGHLAGEPQAGGWRVLLMPIGVEQPGPLKIYLSDVLEGA